MSFLHSQLLRGGLIVTATVVFHIVGLICMLAWIRKLHGKLNVSNELLHAIAVVSFAGFIILGLHIVKIWFWAMMFLNLGAITELEDAIYFSTVTATTVGYGDLVMAEKWRILGSLEAMSGILYFGISTAYLMAVVRITMKNYMDQSEF